jgi:hypothetical protein
MADFRGLLEALSGHGVECILVGGVAARIHGSARFTQDLDIVYARTPENLQRLVRALANHEPYLRGAPPGLPFRWDERTLRLGLNFTLVTTLGDIDLFGDVPGGRSYEDLLGHSVEVEILGLTCRCVDLPTLIRLKRAAGRPKDLEALAELEAIREEEPPG